MLYNGYHLLGMHLAWWFVWFCLSVWVFASRYAISGQRLKKKTSLDIIQDRFMSGQITAQEYERIIDIIENEPEKENIFNYYFF